MRTDVSDDMKPFMRQHVEGKLDYLDAHLQSRNYLLGEHFSAADAYLAWFLLLVPIAGLNIDAHKSLSTYKERLLDRSTLATIVGEDRDAVMTDLTEVGFRTFTQKITKKTLMSR